MRRFFLLVLAGSCFFPVEAESQTDPYGPSDKAKAERAYEEASVALEAEDTDRALALASEAIGASHVFTAEKEVELESAKRVLLDTMILRARSAYRIRRSKYFELLGRAHDAAESWPEARKAYRKALFLNPSFALLEAIASHPDLSVSERQGLRVEGVRLFSDLSEQGSLESNLSASGAFYHRWALQASLDERRIDAFVGEHPDYSFELASFPDVRAATDGGLLASSEKLLAGDVLVFYVPSPGCPRCSEDLDGIGRVIDRWRRQEKLFTLAVFVPETELVAIRRIVRLLAMKIEVGRVEGLPPGLQQMGSELWVVARGGLSWFRRPLGADRIAGMLDRELDELIEFLDETGLPIEEEVPEYHRPLVQLPDREAPWQEWVQPLERLEVGPLTPPEAYRTLTRALRSSHSRASASEFADSLDVLSGLRFAGESKSFLLSRMQPRILDLLLDRAREMDDEIRRAAGADAPFFVDLVRSEDADWLMLQRHFVTSSGASRSADFLLKREERAWVIAWASMSPGQATGVSSTGSGAVYQFTNEASCRGMRLVDYETAEQVYEGCPAEIVASQIVERRNALVEPPDQGLVDGTARQRSLPTFTIPVSGHDAPTPLERSIELFERGDYRGAGEATREAMGHVDPLAAYDLSDLRYNEARCVEASGDLAKALELYRGIGDVSFQDWVVERQRRIENPEARPR